jgi:ATP-dependent Clp protease ATP-binding subunit ClpC
MSWFESAKEFLEKWRTREVASREFWINFTPRATQAITFAREEAQRLNHNSIGTEYILLGLIKLGNGVAVNVLKNLGLSFENVRKEVEKQVGVGIGQKMADNIPFTPRTKKVLEMAKEEAKLLNHTYVGTEHLLLGLLSESEGVAARVFKNFNVNTEQMRKEILNELNPNFLSGDDTKEKSD